MEKSGEDLAWEAYFYPGTQVLKNHLELHDFEELQAAERIIVTRRSEMLEAGQVTIPRTFDCDHLKQIHGYLSQDIYPFSGQWRDIHIGKRTEEGEPARRFLPPNGIDLWMADLSEQIHQTPWRDLDRDAMVKEIADVTTLVNFSHGFREGNGRVGRLCLDHLVEGTGFQLDFAKVDPERWNQAARDSIVPGRTRPAEGPLLFEPQRAVFDNIVVERPAQPAADSSLTHTQRLQQLRASVRPVSRFAPPIGHTPATPAPLAPLDPEPRSSGMHL